MSNLTAQQIYEQTRGSRRKVIGTYFGDPMCDRCGLTQKAGTREATRDFVFANICVGCNIKNNQ